MTHQTWEEASKFRFPEILREKNTPDRVQALMKLWDVGLINMLEFEGHLRAISEGHYDEPYPADSEA